MASRQEEKEARRQARLDAETRENRAAGLRKRLQLVFGGVLALLIIGAVVIVLLGGGGPDPKTGPRQATKSTAALPAASIFDERAAASAAGCKLRNPPDEGRGHIDKVFSAKDYRTNPPTSGAHFPYWAQDGIYTDSNLPQLGKLVHTLEHGRIDIQYRPTTGGRTLQKLEAFLAESDSGYHMLLFPNSTGMDAQVAATAWDWSLTCPEINNKTWDALRTFRSAHIDRGPEKIP